MRAEALLGLKDIKKREKVSKRGHLQAVAIDLKPVASEKPARVLRGTAFKILLISVAIVAGTIILKTYAASFAIEHVLIKGEFHNEQANEIERVLQPHLRGDLITINLSAAHDALTDLAWVKDVSLQRSWPNKIIVRVTEQVPVARWNKIIFMNSEAEVFSKSYSVQMDTLPSLSGPTELAGEVLREFAKLQSLLERNNILIGSLSIDERGTWTIVTKDEVILYLGSRSIESRLGRFLMVMKSGHAPDWSNISSVDLRHSNGFAVSWQAKQDKRHG